MKPAAYELTDREFRRLRALVRTHTAIELSDAKRHLLFTRFSRRLRALGLATFDEYCDLVERGEGEELRAFASAITTNFTRFFREPHHFELLAERVASRGVSAPLRIWSAGCSSGEEPYSIAMTLLEAVPDIAERDVRILATDIDTSVLAAAERGVYPQDRVSGLPPERLRRWFLRGRGANAGKVRIADSPRALVDFRPLNLIEPWPMRGPFDFVFCRNVVIYFSQETRRSLVERFAELQRPGAYLVLGHSEHLAGATDRYAPAGPTTYRRRDAS